MLETMVVHIAEDKLHILKGSAGRSTSYITSCSVGKHHTVHSTFHSHILGKIGQCVVTCLDYLNHITHIGGCHSSGQGLILCLANLCHIVDRINQYTVLPNLDVVDTVSSAVVHLNNIIQYNKCLRRRSFGEAALSGAVVDDYIILE